jgi:uncharacterized protein YdeI (YjbR/CyaY-like superfamily)
VPASAKSASRSFEAVLERTGGRLHWTIIRVPLDVAKVWGTRGQLKVKGEINDFAFRTSIFPTRKGEHFMMVNKKMQAGGKTAVGMKARFRLEPDTEKREVAPPAELTAVLRQSKALAKFHSSLSYSTRSEIAKWIHDGKHKETRVRRAEQMAERLMQTMEAELELPPVIEVALRQNPKARAGWQRMPPSHRRFHLLGIFGYRNPESRARRIAKAMEEMVAYAEKAAEKRRSSE